MVKDMNKMTIEELRKELSEHEQKKNTLTSKKVGVWHVGKDYVIRTVTMIQVGKLIAVEQDELVMENAAWVADTGRWADFLKDGKVNEVEPFPDGQIIIGRHAIIDACIWNHGVLRSQK